LRAAFVESPEAMNQVYNVAVGQRTTPRQLHGAIAVALARLEPALKVQEPQFADFRSGDIRHSLADVGKAARLLGYAPSHDVEAGARRDGRLVLDAGSHGRGARAVGAHDPACVRSHAAR